jgi:ankyrin repeat protein
MVAREEDDEDAEKKDSATTTTTKERRPIPPLHVAARTGDLDALSALLASNHHHHRNDAAKNNTKKNTALKFIDERDVHGRTALHLAAWANEKAIAERLLDSGADVSVGAADGVQAIHFACMKGHLGETMLLFCIPIVYILTLTGIVKTLVSRERANRANIKAKTNKNENCMHFAAKSGNVELVEYLAKKNVSALLKSAKYKYPVDMTNKKEIRDIIERLKEMQEKEEEEKKKNKRMRDDDENEDVIVAEDDAVVLDAAAGPILPPHLMNSGGKNDSKDDFEEEKPASSKKQKKETKAPIMGLSFGEEDE